MKEKKKYVEPVMLVIKLQHKQQILTESPGVNPPSPFNPGGNPLPLP